MSDQRNLKTLKKELDLRYKKLLKKTESILTFSEKITRSRKIQIPPNLRGNIKEYANLRAGKTKYLQQFPKDVQIEIKKHARNFTDSIDRRKCNFEINQLQMDIIENIRILDELRTELQKVDPLKSRKKNKELEITPSDVLERTLLTVLKKSGGKAHISQVFEKMEKLLRHQLTADDREITTEPRERWKVNVSWKRQDLIERGIMTKNSPKGIWMIEKKYLSKKSFKMS
jgi:hypothetical protein